MDFVCEDAHETAALSRCASLFNQGAQLYEALRKTWPTGVRQPRRPGVPPAALAPRREHCTVVAAVAATTVVLITVFVLIAQKPSVPTPGRTDDGKNRATGPSRD